MEFTMLDLNSFIEKHSDAASEDLLKAIWEFGNKQYSKGYNDGYHGFGDDDNEEEQ
jgi:hypothetical protein